MIYSKGSKGTVIGIIQNNLRMLGYDPKGIDCVFGDNTEIAVKKFQNATGLIQDGIVGDCTWNLLIKKIRSIQTALNSYGFNLTVDGIAGINTYTCLINLQKAHNLISDGIVGLDTFKVLFKPNNGYSIDFDISQEGIDFIADYESFYAVPYKGLDSQNQTIGYGHVIISSENFQSLTETEAKSLLKKDLQSFVDSVNIMINGITLSQNQFDALISFAYNCGASALKGSTLLKDIKAKAPIEKIKEDFLMWCNCNGKPALGLYRRRYDEFEIYSNADYTRTYREF